MYSDEEYYKQLKYQEREIKKSIKYWEKVERNLLKKLWSPVWEKQGQAFIEPKKHAAWRRAIKWDSLTRNLYGTYIQDTLNVMRAIELGGNEAGIKAMSNVDFGSNRVLELVEKFHRQGKSFANAYVDSRPDLVDKYPELKKYVGGIDNPLTVEEINRGNEALKEAIAYTIEATEHIHLHEADRSIANTAIKEMQAIAQARGLEFATSKRPQMK
jgi:hypothetical protein